MWIVVFFDLPTNTKDERKLASNFRNNLKKDGFAMFQFSVYTRPCPSRESLEVHASRVQKLIPANGHVSIASLTDKQYGSIINYFGGNYAALSPMPKQLQMF